LTDVNIGKYLRFVYNVRILKMYPSFFFKRKVNTFFRHKNALYFESIFCIAKLSLHTQTLSLFLDTWMTFTSMRESTDALCEGHAQPTFHPLALSLTLKVGKSVSFSSFSSVVYPVFSVLQLGRGRGNRLLSQSTERFFPSLLTSLLSFTNKKLFKVNQMCDL